jgi:hypothetical protein
VRRLTDSRVCRVSDESEYRWITGRFFQLAVGIAGRHSDHQPRPLKLAAQSFRFYDSSFSW